MAVEVERRLFTVDEYHQMIETGIFHEDERIELINGELIRMVPVGHSHSGQVNRLNRTLGKALNDRVIVSVQNPVALPDFAEPQPDIMLLRPRDDDYSRSNPTAADVLLIIEVADSSFAYYQHVKGLMYAEAGIQDYWIVNLLDGQLLVYRQPTPTGYTLVQTLARGDSVTLLAFPDVTIQVSELLI
jgi:Uma2 family endonuclease